MKKRIEMRGYLGFGFWVVVVFFSWRSGYSRAGELVDLYYKSLEHDQKYAAVRAGNLVGYEYEAQGKAGLLPEVMISSQVLLGVQDQLQRDDKTTRFQRSQSYGVQLVQPLLNLKKWRAYEHGALQKQLLDVSFKIARQELMLRVAELYFNVRAKGEMLSAIDDLCVFSEQQVARVVKSFELGSANIAEVHEARASYDRKVAERVKASSELAIAQYSLKDLAPMEVTVKPVEINFLKLMPPTPPIMTVWLESATTASYEVLQADLLLSIADNQISSRKAEYFPEIDFIASRNIHQRPESDLFANSAVVGVRMRLSLYDGGRKSSSVREARAIQTQREYELEHARRTAALKAREAWFGVMDGIKELEALEAAKLSAQSSAKSNLYGYKVGMRNSIDVLDSRSQLSTITQRVSHARYEALMSILRLKASAGNLEVKDFAEIDEALMQ